MATYIIMQELGPEYWLRTPDENEDLTGKRTIELTQEQFDDYSKVQDMAWAWQENLRMKYELAG